MWNQCVGVMNDGTDSVDTMMHIIFKCHIYHHRQRRIKTDRTSQQREAGANYNRNDIQISEISALESWMMVQMLLKLWCTYYWNSTFTIIVTVGSIRTDLANNEKQGPTTTQTTAKYVKSVHWSHERWYRCCWHYDPHIIEIPHWPSSSPSDRNGQN